MDVLQEASKIINSKNEQSLLKKLERLSETAEKKILKLRGYVLLDNGMKEVLEILIYRGISSSTTHPTQFEIGDSILPENSKLMEAELLQAPINPAKEENLAGPFKPEEFTKIKYWAEHKSRKR